MKLALVAMSGVRVVNPELLALGLTLPGFVERSELIARLPSLSLLTIAGATPSDIAIDYIEIDDPADRRNLTGQYDAVAISSFTARIKDAYHLADQLRAAGTRVILGGLHVTACPAEALQHADSIVTGEGEAVWPTVIDDLRVGRLKQHYDGRGAPFNLANAPMPRFDLLDPSRYNRITVQTQRGCPFSCEFCASSIRLSPRFKTKPIARVIDEIRTIKSIWPRPFIEFADDNTFANPAHGKRLLDALAKEDVRWFTETDSSIADDGDLLDRMRDSGCAQVLIGIEGPSRRGLDGIEQNAKWKALRAESNLAAIERIQSRGISVNGCFVLGLDGQGPESFEAVRDFVRISRLREVQVTVQTAFPATPLYQRLSRENRLLAADAWETCTLFDVNFKPSNMTVAELEGGLRWLMQELYSPEAVAARKGEWRKTLRGLTPTS